MTEAQEPQSYILLDDFTYQSLRRVRGHQRNSFLRDIRAERGYKAAMN